MNAMRRERLQGPTVYRDAATDAAILDDGARRIRLSFSSETPYLRSSWFDDPWNEVLGHDEGEVDLTRLNDGAPALFGHNSYGRDAHVGVVERAWVENGRGYADVRLSAREDVAGLWQDIKDGIVRNVSVGYQILERTLVRANTVGPSDYRVTRWLPMEISFVPIPADNTVGVGRAADPAQRFTIQALNDEDTNMTGETRTDTPAANPPVNTDAAVRAAAENATRAERERAAAIRDAVRAAGLDTAFAETLIDNGTAVDAARAAVIAALAERQAPPTNGTTGAHVQGGRDLSREASIAGITDAFLLRMNAQHKPGEQVNAFRHLSLVEIARHSLATFAGVRSAGMMSRHEVAVQFLRFHTSSDFPNLLGNVAVKRLRNQYEENVPTYARWARRAPNAPDFKLVDVVQLSNNPDLNLLSEGEEYSYGSVTDGRESYRVVTFGRGLQLSRQAIVNDDLRAFDRAITGFASAARRRENALVYGELTNGTTTNLSDGVALFATSAARGAGGGNLVTGPGGVIDIASLTVGRSRMRAQVGRLGEPLNIAPRFLICGVAYEQAAYQFTSNQYVPATAATVNEFRAGGRTALEPIVDAVIPGNTWYLAADSADVDTVEYMYLDGAEGVYVESMADFETDSLKIKGRLDFAAKAIDFRGLFRNAGA